MNKDISREMIFAAVLYEMRCQLSAYLGSNVDAPDDVRMAAHLAYALHNDAASVANGSDAQEFDYRQLQEQLMAAEKMIGSCFADTYGILSGKANH